MPEILTPAITPSLSDHITHQLYNGLDTCVTLEVFEVLQEYRTEASDINYSFSRAMQAPALEMMLRGFKVNQSERWKAIKKLEARIAHVQEILDEFANAIWGRGLNPGSYKQKYQFFYEAMKLPVQYKYDKGKKVATTNREALEKLSAYYHAEPICNCILRLQDIRKKVSVLRSEVDSDGRMRTSYNVAGPETNRWSSSKNVEGGGTNLQNITEELRVIFESDPGKKLAYIDLAQAESRALGFLCWVLFGAHAYLDACESGDLHTASAKLIWPRTINWSGDPALDREKAEQPFYRQFSYRDMSKRGGHAKNYYGQDFTVAKHLKVPTKVIEEFTYAYFKAFPEIPLYHKHTARELQLNGFIPTPLGTSRYFFGRLTDDSTLREAIAHVPQHMVGVLLNLALWRVWYHLGRKVDILAQIHDAFIIQYPEEKEDEILPKVLALMATPLTHAGRTMIIPSDCNVGWNWGKHYDEAKAQKDAIRGNKPKPLNRNGLREWKPGKPDTRRREALTGLDRLVS